MRESHQPGSPAEGEYFHFHAVHLCCDKMSKLMDEDHETEPDNPQNPNHSIDPFIQDNQDNTAGARTLPADQGEKIVEKGRGKDHRIHRIQYAAARGDDDP